MKVDGAIRSLIQGVSQQPRRSRFPGQCTLQENCSSNPVEGLQRRPPTENIASLFTDASAQQWYDYEIAGTRYIVAAGSGELRVFDTAGTEYTVNESGSAFDYLDGSDLAFTTLDGVTYISNTAMEVAMDAATATYQDHGSLVFLLGGQYGRTYTVSIRYGGSSTITVTHTAPDGSSAAHTAQITTDYLADKIRDALEANGTFAASFTVELAGDVMYIYKDNGDPIEVTVTDGDGGNNMYVVNNYAPSISKLPRFAPQGYIVRIQASSTAEAADLWLQFVIPAAAGGSAPATGAGFGKEGTWIETVAPEIPYLLDTATMPHVLTFDSGTGQFTFAEGAWLGRQVGDEDSNEDPSFIGRTINSMSHFQGRLVFLAGTYVIMSRTNVPLDFFLKSATGLIDSDPIDITSTVKNSSDFKAAVPFNRDLVVFSDNAQFIVFGRSTLTPRNSSLVLTTTFESELRAAPVAAGRNIFFAINYGQYTGIREFYTEGSEDINDSRPITQHVLKYIPGKIELMATTSNFNMLIAHTDASATDLFVYEYIWVEGTKAQSSWSKWTMPNDLAYYFFVESIIYMIAKIGNDYVLEKLDLDTQFDTGMEYQVLLDRKTYTAGVNTTMSDPLDNMPDIADMVFIQGEGCPTPGMRVLVSDYNAGTITLEDDMDGGTVIAGIRYMSKYRPTMPFVKDSDGVKIGTGKLKLSKFFVNYKDSAEINAKIVSDYRDDQVITWSGRVTNNPNTVVGEAAIQSGTFIVPFKDNVDNAELELYSDSHTPMTLMDIEWQGQYNKRGQRIAQGGE